jgi:hypothetical protein
MSMIADVGYIPLPLMRVEPRISTDRYGRFEWESVVGMARAHELGVKLLYGVGNNVETQRQWRAMCCRHDRHFLMLFAQWISKGRSDLLEDGLVTIKSQCTPGAFRIARALSASMPLSRLPLYVAAKGYGTVVRANNQIQSLRGWALTRKNSGSVQSQINRANIHHDDG